MMSEPTKVDSKTVDELTGKIVLLIEERRPWNEPELMHRQLSSKVRNYVRYIRSDEFALEHGQRPQDTIVRLVNAESPSQNTIEFLTRVGYELRKHGIDFEHQIGEDGIPYSLTEDAQAAAGTAPVVLPPGESSYQAAQPDAPTEAAPEQPEVAVEPSVTEADETEVLEAEPAPFDDEETLVFEAQPPQGVSEAEAWEPEADLEEDAAASAAPPTEDAVLDESDLADATEIMEVAPKDDLGLPKFEFEPPTEADLNEPAAVTADDGPTGASEGSAYSEDGPAVVEEPSELELLINAEAEESVEFIEPAEAEEPEAKLDAEVLAGAQVDASGKNPQYPPFFPEEEFGRAVPDMDDVEAILMGGSEAAVIETSSGKRVLLDVVEDASASAVDEGQPNIGRAVGAALAAAFTGALVWAGLAIASGQGASPLAAAVGLMVGFSVRLKGAGHTWAFRLVGVLGTLVGSLLGSLLAAIALDARGRAEGIAEMLSALTANLTSVQGILAAYQSQYALLDLAALAVALFIAYRLSASKPAD